MNAPFQNAGQTCSAATRVLIEKRYSELTERLVKGISSLRSGLALQDLDAVLDQQGSERSGRRISSACEAGRVNSSQKEASRMHLKGEIIWSCMVGSVPPQHTLARDGVLDHCSSPCLLKGEEGIELANNGLRFGFRCLDKGWWTSVKVARRLKSGRYSSIITEQVGVELPFGGVKLSGHGREKFEALYGFSAIKPLPFITEHHETQDKNRNRDGLDPVSARRYSHDLRKKAQGLVIDINAEAAREV